MPPTWVESLTHSLKDGQTTFLPLFLPSRDMINVNKLLTLQIH